MINELSALNTVLRRQQAAPAASADNGAYMEQISAQYERARKAEVTNLALMEELSREKERSAARIAELQAQLAAANDARSAAEKECAEYKGRCAAMSSAAPAPAVVDTSKQDALAAELTALKVTHAACAPTLAAARADAANEKRISADLAARLKAAEEEEPEEEDDEDEGEKASGCEIDVIRGGDDRIRSLKVRYV